MSFKRKLKKFVNNPEQFFIDSKVASITRLLSQKKYKGNKLIAHGIGINDWKRDYIQSRYTEYKWIFYPFKTSAEEIFDTIDEPKKHRIIVWGYSESASILDMAIKNGVELYRMEDGFIRSIDLGANRELPVSLVLDKTGTLYFDARSESGLENILNEYDFESNPELIVRAKKLMNQLLRNNISKYNHVASRSAKLVYGEFCEFNPLKTRVLVLGQVESDASIKFGCSEKLDNESLVRKARKDHPSADIFFKPHPDVLAGKRNIEKSFEVISEFSYVVMCDLSLPDSFETIDEVYTITSLSGFEALMRGKKVTTLGCPFYSGWGLTNDCQINVRRRRILSLEEVFAASYILYPSYFNAFLPVCSSIEDALDYIGAGIVGVNKRSKDNGVVEKDLLDS